MRYPKGATFVSETRDIPLLVEVRNAKFITHAQLYELLRLSSLEYCREAFNWRVRRLVQGDYISRLDSDFGRGTTVYRINRAGLVRLADHCQSTVVLNAETAHLPHPSLVPHSLELTEIRLALARSNLLLAWKADIEIASENTISLSPLAKDYDAIVDVWINDRAARFGLEYERSIKSAQRYGRIRKSLESEDVLNPILYLTSDDGLARHLAAQLSTTPKRLAFATAKTFRESLLDAMVITFIDEPRVAFRSLLGGVF
jgi:hypothetical protein